MTDSLRLWLQQELNRRNWTHARLATKAGISRSLVTRILSGSTEPSIDFCVKIAIALDTPPDKALSLAGILPPTAPALPEDSPTLISIVELARLLPPDQQNELLKYIRFLVQNLTD